MQGTTREGARCSTSKAFLDPGTRKRRNLLIGLRSTVTRLIMDDIDVVGVEVSRDGTLYTPRARKEVILSAGALNSPQILMLSGIGPRNHLQVGTDSMHGFKWDQGLYTDPRAFALITNSLHGLWNLGV